jgi:hypothetical protein
MRSKRTSKLLVDAADDLECSANMADESYAPVVQHDAVVEWMAGVLGAVSVVGCDAWTVGTARRVASATRALAEVIR